MMDKATLQMVLREWSKPYHVGQKEFLVRLLEMIDSCEPDKPSSTKPEPDGEATVYFCRDED